MTVIAEQGLFVGRRCDKGKYVTECMLVCKNDGKASRPTLFFLSACWGFPKVCMLLGGGELEEWKGCTFLTDGIRLPISGAGGNWKIIPHFPS